MSRSPKQMTLASLCCRDSFAAVGSDTSAARTPGTLFAAIEMPMPDAAHADAARLAAELDDAPPDRLAEARIVAATRRVSVPTSSTACPHAASRSFKYCLSL